MAPSVVALLRSLEREYARECAEHAVNQFIEAVITEWDEFVALDDDAVDIVNTLRLVDVGLPTMSAAVRYLNKCRLEGARPNPRHLAARLSPWTIRPLTSSGEPMRVNGFEHPANPSELE